MARLHREVYGLVIGMSDCRSKIVNESCREGHEMHVCGPCLFSNVSSGNEPEVHAFVGRWIGVIEDRCNNLLIFGSSLETSFLSPV